MSEWDVFLLSAYATAAGVVWARHRRDIDVLLDADLLGAFIKLPGAAAIDAAHLVQQYALRRMKHTLVCAVLLLSYCHVYSADWGRRLAARTAARMQPPPYGCLSKDDERTIGWAKYIVYTIWSDQQELDCAGWRARTTCSVLPVPLADVVDLVLLAPLRAIDQVSDCVGRTIETFLGHFGYLIQAYFLVLLPAAILLGVLASKSWWLYALRRVKEWVGRQGCCTRTQSRRTRSAHHHHRPEGHPTSAEESVEYPDWEPPGSSPLLHRTPDGQWCETTYDTAEWLRCASAPKER